MLLDSNLGLKERPSLSLGHFCPQSSVLFLSFMATVERKGHLRASQWCAGADIMYSHDMYLYIFPKFFFFFFACIAAVVLPPLANDAPFLLIL